MKLLVFTPNDKYDEVLKTLTENIYNIIIVKTKENFYNLLSSDNFDVAVFDVKIFDKYELEIYKIIENKKDTYLLSIIDLEDKFSMSEALNIGIDDYLLKGMPYYAMKAKLVSIKRFISKYKQKLSSHILSSYDLVMNLNKRSVTKLGVNIELTKKEFEILEYLLKNKNKIISRDEILKVLWDTNTYEKSNIVDVYINYIRAKLSVVGEKDIIKTIRGIGYTIQDGKNDE